MVTVEAPPVPSPEIAQLEAKLALHSIYFQTARPTAENPEGGLLPSQAEILKTLAADYINYLKYKPDAHVILGGHADNRARRNITGLLLSGACNALRVFLWNVVCLRTTLIHARLDRRIS